MLQRLTNVEKDKRLHKKHQKNTGKTQTSAYTCLYLYVYMFDVCYMCQVCTQLYKQTEPYTWLHTTINKYADTHLQKHTRTHK